MKTWSMVFAIQVSCSRAKRGVGTVRQCIRNEVSDGQGANVAVAAAMVFKHRGQGNGLGAYIVFFTDWQA